MKQLVMKMKKAYTVIMLGAACIMVSCSGGSSSNKPLSPLADVAKMYDGLTHNTTSPVDDDNSPIRKATRVHNEALRGWAGIIVPTESGNESIEILDPIQIVSGEREKTFQVDFAAECKVKMIDSVPRESDLSSNGLRGFAFIGYDGETPVLVIGGMNVKSPELENADEIDGMPSMEYPEGGIYTIRFNGEIPAYWANRYAKIEKFKVTFSDDPDIAESGVLQQMQEEKNTYIQSYGI